MSIAAASLDQRVTIQQKAVTRSASGAEIVTWQTVAELWAAVLPIRGREFFAAQQTQDSTDVRVIIRYRTGIAREMRVMHKGQALDIVSVINPGSRGEMLELMCVSGVRNGK